MEDLIKRMLVKDHFKRISWEELFEYDLKISTEVEADRERGRSPFMKKQFNSVKNSENPNGLIPSLNNYSTKNYPGEVSRPLLFKKA